MKMIPLTDGAITALVERELDPEIAVQYGVASVEPAKPTKHEWIAFPHRLGGAQVHWVARVITEPKPANWCTQQKSGQRCLWNQDVVWDKTLIAQATLLITEGHCDALALMTVGFRAVCSVPDGSSREKPTDGDPLPTAKYAYLADIRDQLRLWPSVTIATDADGPGRALFDDLARIIGRSKCRVLEYPEGCKDANEVLMKLGREALVAAVEGARWIHIGGIYTLSTLPPVSITPAVTCGISGIDDLWRIRPGELSVITGIPNAGKTILLNQVGVSLAERHGWSIAYCSPEQFWPVHLNRLITVHANTPAKHLDARQMAAQRDWIEGHMIWIAAEGDVDMSVDWLCERIATVGWRYNCKILFVDPWNQLDHDRSVSESISEYSGEMLKRLWRVGREFGVHVCLSCHPHKPTGHRDGKIPPPNGYSIADSAHFVNKPDLGATLHRENGHTLFWCWKARYADGEWYDNGKLGTVKLGLNTLSMRFAKLENAQIEEEA